MSDIVDEYGFTLVMHDPWSGKTVWRKEAMGEITYRTDERVDELLRHNTEVRNNSSGNAFGDWTKIASIPSNVLWDEKTGLMDAFRYKDDRYLSKWLNDGDNRAWRTFEGKV